MYLNFYIEVTASSLGFTKHNAFSSVNCQRQDVVLEEES